MMSDLGNRILRIVRRDGGRRIAELAELTSAPLNSVKSTCWALTNTGRLDYCAPAPPVLPGPKKPSGEGKP